MTDQQQTLVEENKSALEDNIERKGKNAYYFAHAHKATGPKWDGKEEPRLLATNTEGVTLKPSSTAFDLTKSTITSYAFCDEESKVKVYITYKEELEDDSCVVLNFSETSFHMQVKADCLCFQKLHGEINGAKVRVKGSRITLILLKKENHPWTQLGGR